MAGPRDVGDKDNQLSLFGSAAIDEKAPPAVEPLVTEEDERLAASLPRFVRFGTSSWSFPGWKGIVWKGAPSEALLARAGLEAYARHPLLRAVSLDRSYYGPLRAEEVEGYSGQVKRAASAAPAFRIVSKVWDEITTAVFPKHARYGARTGARNPHFLDADRFVGEVLAPYASHLDVFDTFVFELTPMPKGAIDERAFVARVDDFVSRLPSGPRWAFELRNAELFGTRWLDMLRANRAAHVFNFWTAMPKLGDQLRARGITAPFTVVRLMLPPYTRYAARKEDFAPFDKLAAVEPEMRSDVVAILQAAAEADVDDAFVLVNNKAEGSAPLTIRALAERTATALGAAGPHVTQRRGDR